MPRNRQFFWYYIYLLLILFFAFLFLTVFLERKTNNSFIEHNKMILGEAGRTLMNTFDPAYFQNRDMAAEYAEKTAQNTSFRITIIQPDGTVIADSNSSPENMDNHAGRPEVLEAANGGTGLSVRFSATETKHFFYAAFRVDNEKTGGPAGFFRIAVPVERVFEITGNLSTIFLVSAAVVFLLFSGVSILTLRNISTSLLLLKEAADEYSRGNLSHRSYIDGPRELSVLASAMNAMSENLRESLETVVRQRNEQEVILSSMIESVILLDSNLCIRSINKAGLELFGADSSEIIGKSILSVMRNSELHAFAQNLLGGNAADREISISLYRLGERSIENPPVDLQIHGSITPLKDTNGRGVLLVFNDITRLKMLERIRKDFVANVSHELKTPITSIKGFVETLKTIPPEDASQSRHFLDIIDNHTERLRLIIDDLLTISRLEQYPETEIEKGSFSLAEIIRTALQNCRTEADEKNITIHAEEGTEVSVSGNQRLLEQAITNLLDNAVKYSGQGSTVTVRNTVIPGDGTVKIDIIDTGRGIPEEHLNRIFERFYRVEKSRSREQGGTGLGLAIVKHIALIHGGDVLVESKAGKGSTFSLILTKC